MSLTKRVFIGICLASSLLLASCGSGAATKGYSIIKSEIEAEYSPDKIYYNNASYARIAEPYNRDVFYYEVSYTRDLSTLVATSTQTDYFMWYLGDTFTQKSSSGEFVHACMLVKTGSAKGTVGRLK